MNDSEKIDPRKWRKWRLAGAIKGELFTLKKIINGYPPKKEKQIPFNTGKEAGTVSAIVSRDLEGRILYVVPGSATLITSKQLAQPSVEKAGTGKNLETILKSFRH